MSRTGAIAGSRIFGARFRCAIPFRSWRHPPSTHPRRLSAAVVEAIGDVMKQRSFDVVECNGSGNNSSDHDYGQVHCLSPFRRVWVCRLETHRAENRAGELQLSDFGEQVELVRNRLTVWDGWADQPDPLALWSEERRDQGAHFNPKSRQRRKRGGL
jgi:hypothetical protein